MHASPPPFLRPCARCPCLCPWLPVMPLWARCMVLSSAPLATGRIMRGRRRAAVQSGVDRRSCLSPHISTEYAAARAAPALPISEHEALSPPHPEHSCLHSAWLCARTFDSSVLERISPALVEFTLCSLMRKRSMSNYSECSTNLTLVRSQQQV